MFECFARFSTNIPGRLRVPTHTLAARVSAVFLVTRGPRMSVIKQLKPCAIKLNSERRWSHELLVTLSAIGALLLNRSLLSEMTLVLVLCSISMLS